MTIAVDMGRKANKQTNKQTKGGASLKLTVLNKTDRIWTMVAGGGGAELL